jgi:hypothetical protein
MVKREVLGDPDLKDEQIISRYMDLPKFVDLLRTNELHLEPAVNFDDCLEGTLPESIRESMRDHLIKEKYDKSIEELGAKSGTGQKRDAHKNITLRIC